MEIVTLLPQYEQSTVLLRAPVISGTPYEVIRSSKIALYPVALSLLIPLRWRKSCMSLKRKTGCGCDREGPNCVGWVVRTKPKSELKYAGPRRVNATTSD